MHDYMKTLMSAFKLWVKEKFKDSVANWDQNDDTALDYIKNRTHWSEIANHTLIEETTVEVLDGPSPIGSLAFVEGETYFVTFEGITYECIAWEFYNGGLIVGNETIVGLTGGNSNNEPFMCCSMDNSCLVVVPENGTYTIKIEGKKEVVHKLDEKYLPEDIVFETDIESIESRIDTADSKITTIENKVSENEKSITTLQDTCEILSDTHADLFQMDENDASYIKNNILEVVTGANSFASIENGETVTYNGKTFVHVGNCSANSLSNVQVHFAKDVTETIASEWIINFVSGSSYYNLGSPFYTTYFSEELAILNTNCQVGICFNGKVIFWSENSEIYIDKVYLIEGRTVKDEHISSNIARISDIESSLVEANEYTDTEINSAKTEVNNYADTQDAAMLLEAKAYTDAQIATAITNITEDTITLRDVVNGHTYLIQMQNGSLVSFCKALSIEVTIPPTKSVYSEGEEFDPTGMIITATCENGSTREVTLYTYSMEDYIVTITYVEGETTHNITFEVTSLEKLLIDFEYTNNNDGTYTLTDWKETLNGEASTEMIIPDNEVIIL